MANVLDKVRKLKAKRPQGGNGGRMQGIFHQWKDADNIIRLAGEFLEVKTHFIAPAPKRKERGLCRGDAFQGDDKLPQVINCLNWDIEKEEERSTKTCPICKLNAIAHAVLQGNPTDEEKEMFKKLRSDAGARTYLKWNIIDRDDPHVVMVDDGNESKVLGYKIATVGMEAWDDIEGIFDQMGFDITDPVDGIDINVTKGHNGQRVAYSAQACIDSTKKPPCAKVTPLSDEEKAMDAHNLKQVCGKQVDGQKVIDALHEDLRELLEVSIEDEEPEEQTESASDSAPAEEKAAPAEESAEVSDDTAADAEEAAAIEDAIEEDGDGLLDGTASKKA